MNSTQADYLRQMGVPVWVRRHQPRAANTSAGSVVPLRLGPGDGGCLFLCETADESASRMASDLSRLLAEPAVWAWPDTEGKGQTLEAAIESQLLTQVVIYGQELAQTLFGGDAPKAIGQASLVVVPSLPELSTSGSLRRQCWQELERAAVVMAE